MTRYLKQADSGVWIQFEAGRETYWLGDCIDLANIPNPRIGGVNLIQCWNRARNGFVTHGDMISPPGPVTFSVSQLLRSAQEFLESVQAPFILYAMMHEGGNAGVFGNWTRGAIVDGVQVVDVPLNNIAAHNADEVSNLEWQLSGWPPRIDVRKLTTSRRTSGEILAANCITALRTLRFEPGGSLLVPGDRMVVGSDAGAGTANLMRSADGGVTWAATAADPFAATFHILAVQYFEIGQNVYRILAARGTNPAAPCMLGYSDDAGATWTTVLAGATNGEAVAGPKGLFVLDAEHCWLGTDSGNIYFSDDGGESWAVQSALGVTGGADINCVHFCDEMVGYAVCDTDIVIKTTDGGVNWTLATATGLGVDLLSVWCFSANRIIIGSAIIVAGSLVQSWDGGVTYTHLAFTGHTVKRVQAISFQGDSVGVLVSNTAGIVGSLHHTVDGGNSWREVAVPTNVGLNDIDLFNVNAAAFCGEVQGGTQVIGRASG